MNPAASPSRIRVESPRTRPGLLTDLLASAARHGDQIAFLHDSESITHAEFGRRWSNLAATLQARGIQPGDRVVIALPKSIDAVVAMAGCLAAGGVYVPVDVAAPPARSRYIVENSGARFLLTDAEFLADVADLLAPLGLASVLLAGEDFPIPGEYEPSPVSRAPDDLAYILYTSGSTGHPKGVQTTHRNLLQFIGWAIDEFDLGPDDVLSCHASLTFDLTTFDIYAGLAVGGSVVLIPADDMRSPAALGRLIEERRITVWYSVPSILQLMLNAGVFDRHDVSSLRHVLFAGEVFPISPLRRLVETVPGPAYYNLYGPTETNVCTFHRVGPIDPDRTEPLPIGRPLPGAAIRILDAEGSPVPPGEVGELVVQGPCVTPGYWRLEGHRNVEHHALGAHATGDLVRLEGTELVYHGRIDNMIKLRGYRIELGEIESVLGGHPAIDQVAVIPVTVGEETRLVACYSLRPDEPAPSLIVIKEYCAKRLPPYMIPHQARRFDALPQNANGKIDRGALAEELAPAAG